MNYARRALPALLAVGLAATVVSAQNTSSSSVDPSGTWRREYDRNNERVAETLRLTLLEDGKLSGALWLNEIGFEIKDGTVPTALTASYLYLRYFSKPKHERILYGWIAKNRPKSIVEVGLQDAVRAGRMIELAMC